MELKDYKFHWSGDDFRFAVFSDGPCRADYLHHVLLPIVRMRVEVYEIKPGIGARWVVVQQRDGENESCKFFVKTGETFRENVPDQVPTALKSEILRKFPKLNFEARSSDRRVGRRFRTSDLLYRKPATSG